MGRTKLVLDKAELQRVVSELENTQQFTTQGELWKALEQSEWARNQKPRPLTAQVAYARARELGIVCKTPVGKRGRANFGPSEERGKRVSRAVKMAKFSPSFQKMRAEFPTTYLPLIQKAEKGSLRAAMKLKCAECSGFNRGEVLKCECVSCSLYPHR